MMDFPVKRNTLSNPRKFKRTDCQSKGPMEEKITLFLFPSGCKRKVITWSPAFVMNDLQVTTRLENRNCQN